MIFRPVLVGRSSVRICSVSDTLRRQSSAPHPVRSSPRGLSGIECRPVQRVHRPGVCVVPCVVCPGISGTACLAACDVQSFRVRWGLGSPPLGYMGRAVGGVVDTSRRKNSKKAFSPYPSPLFCAKHPTPIANLKNFPQKQKDPYKGSEFCAILALQALKGRNLQWLKVK